MGNSDDFRRSYDRWNNKNNNSTDEEQEQQEETSGEVIYYAVTGYDVYKFPRKSKKEKVYHCDTMKKAQDFILSQDRSFEARFNTDHWLIRWVDQFDLPHYQRWNVDRSRISDAAAPTCGWGYDENYIKYIREKKSKNENWRPPFIVDGMEEDEIWD